MASSDPISDTLTKDVDSQIPSNTSNLASREATHTLWATNPFDDNALTPAYFFLYDLCGEKNIKTEIDKDGFLSWTVVFKEGHTINEVNHPGIRLEKPDPSFFPVPPDIRLYLATPVDRSNEEECRKTLEFLKSKVEDADSIMEVRMDKDVVGWGKLQLSTAAKAEVEAYEGVALMGDDAEGIVD
jgi:hypothetical protein